MSLLEALVALAIAGMISLFAFPHLERVYHVMDVRFGAQTLAVDLRRTRATALREGVAAALALERDGKGYDLPDGTKRSLPDGVMVKGSGTRFFPDGTSSGGVFVVRDASRFVRVAVEPSTGAVAVVVPP